MNIDEREAQAEAKWNQKLRRDQEELLSLLLTYPLPNQTLPALLNLREKCDGVGHICFSPEILLARWLRRDTPGPLTKWRNATHTFFGILLYADEPTNMDEPIPYPRGKTWFAPKTVRRHLSLLATHGFVTLSRDTFSVNTTAELAFAQWAWHELIVQLRSALTPATPATSPPQGG